MTPRVQGLRVLIGAESSMDAEAALRLVERLADSDVSELGGLMLRLSDITAVPRLARQRLVTPSGHLEPAPDAGAAARWPAREAAAFRKRLIAIARNRKWVFEAQPGDMRRIVGLTETWDAVIVGCRLMHRLPGRVVLVSGPGGAAPQTARFTAEIARSMHTEITPMPRDDDLPARLARQSVTAVIVDLGGSPAPDPAFLTAVIDAARCPVILTGGGG